MLLLGLPRLAFMAVMLCTLAAALGNRVIPSTSELDLELSSQDNGWKYVRGPNSFFAEVYISRSGKYIAVSQMVYDGRTYDSHQTLLSIWKEESGLSARKLRHIKYYDVHKQSDIDILDDIFTTSGYDPDRYDQIPEISVKRNSMSSGWSSLRRTSFGSDAIDICTEFLETNGLYIESFDIGRDGYDGRWIRVNFAKTK